MSISNFGLTIMVLLGMAGTLFSVIAGVYAVDGGGRRVTILVGGVLAIWQALVLTFAVQGFFVGLPGETAPRIALLALPLTLGWIAASLPAVRAVLDRIPADRLVRIQTFRVEGAVFLIGTAVGLFPWQFGLPAGIGDVLVGLMAPTVAKNLALGSAGSVSAARIWNALGMLDLVVALSTGALTSPGAAHLLALGHPNLYITRYPFVIVPTLLVPLALITHGLTGRALGREVREVREDRGQRVALSA